MSIENTISSFEEGLRRLHNTSDYVTMQQVIIEMLEIAPPDKSHIARDRIARVVRQKQAMEAEQARGYQDALSAIDKKYRDLARVLGEAPVGRRYTAQIQKQNSQNSYSLKGLGQSALSPLAILGWVKEKRPVILKGAAVVGLAGGAYLLYSKYTNGTDEKKEKESDFDRTIRSIQKYRAFTRMAKNPEWSDEFDELTTDKKKKTKKNKKEKEKEKDESKLGEWEQEEQQLMKNMDSAYKSLAEKPSIEYEIPKLPAPKSKDPLPILSNEVSTTKHSEATRKSRKRKSATKARAKAKNPSTKSSNKNVEGSGRLIPIVKRTKRVRKI